MASCRAASLDELWAGELLGVTVNGVRVLLVRFGDDVYAYEDRCVHEGVRLSEGSLEGGIVTCAAHGWRYDARTGEGVNPAGVALRRFPVEVDDEGAILVDLEARESEAKVGPILEAGSDADAVIAAIRERNPSAVVLDRGAYARVEVPGRCAFTRGAVERHLGRAFRLPGDLERIMPSFQGNFVVSADAAEWSAGARR
jgi:toluene monooxygenase system ferredoxin subunit